MKNAGQARTFAAAALAVIVGSAQPAHALFGSSKKEGGKTQDPPKVDDSQKKQEQLPGMKDESNAVKFQVPNAAPDASAPPPGAVSGDASKTAAPPASLPGSGGLPTEVVIKSSEGGGAKLKVNKPALNIDVDAFESIRASLEPDESLLLAESPFTVSWRRTYPEFLNNERVVQPWRMTFSDRPGIIFAIRDQLNETLQRPLEDKEARGYQWSLTIADEEGRVFQHYEGSKDPPEQLIWNGQNDQGEWIKAGRSYSAIYMFTDSGGAPRTKVGKPVQFTGVVHQEKDGLHVTLDSSALFGPSKDARTIQKSGEGLLRSAADLIKRRYSGIPIRVIAYANVKELAEAQVASVQSYLMQELMILQAHIFNDADHAQFSEQRTEIVLLNR
ncbi:MAG: hypothetical protein HY078_05090 [Elusimicrobia bacterium]|nr:hypothetical protein [Elusimicrobiota bacterium]